ncbi:MAG: TatD family hydrolase [Firmicutes bacterium]|nr:TatD family hydrolase [Bacillota bacterium]MCM1402067.1 TatD family hydrolase [Bacteroides sp.]MCM1478007.1 TatD family hydrolase [Bacteroides sp.]
MIDTHTHLYLPEFTEGEPGGDVAAVERALNAGVEHLIFPNVDLGTIEPMKGLHARFEAATSMAMGLHPTEVRESWRDDLVQVMAELGDGKDYVAVGEVGIDLYWDKSFEQEQMQVLEAQVKRAVELDLPVIIHCREGLPQTLEVLQGVRGSRGVMHSFGGNAGDVDAVRRVVDYHFGINGIVTFKNSKLRNTLPAIGLSRLLLETDSPYLAPVPKRGKRNESAYLRHIATHVAESLDTSFERIDEVTSANARQLFGLM